MAITAEERQVGRRIRLVRNKQGVLQRFAARQMWLSRDQLNRIERGEVAAPFFAGLLFCLLTDLNPLWLAFGDSEERFGFFAFRGANLHRDLNQNAGATFLEILKRHRADFLRFARMHARDQGLYQSPQSISLFRLLYLSRPPQDEHVKNVGTYNVLQGIDPSSIEQVPVTGRRNAALIKDVSKRLLTIQQAPETVDPMRREWPQLRERIQKLVRKRGMRSALARDIGVSRQAINAVLSRKGTHGPSAEYALRLSKWVEIAEAKQQKSAGSAITRPARKTRRKSKV